MSLNRPTVGAVGAGAPRARPRAVICIVLVGLLVYNPFAGLMQSHAALSVDRLARNRASVGASELQHYTPVTNPLVEDLLVLEATGETILVETAFPLATNVRPEPVDYREFSSNLNFRPPPSAYYFSR